MQGRDLPFYNQRRLRKLVSVSIKLAVFPFACMKMKHILSGFRHKKAHPQQFTNPLIITDRLAFPTADSLIAD